MTQESDHPASALGPARGVYARAGGLAVFGLLLVASWQIVAPFAVSLAWALALAVSVHPVQHWLAARIGGRERSAAALLSLSLIFVVLLPVGLLMLYATQAMQALAEKLVTLRMSELPPPAVLEHIPLVGDRLREVWLEVQHGDFAAFSQLEGAVGGVAGWLLDFGLAVGGSFTQVLIAIVLVFPILLGADRSVGFARKLAQAVDSRRGVMLLHVATRVVRGVSVGVIGGAAVATALLLLGLALAGTPGLGLIGVATFLLALVQAPIFLVGIAAGAWFWWQGAFAWAVFVAVWSVGVHVAYSVMQPILISKEAGLPMSVMFLGVLGGFLAYGFVGLFIGPVVLGVLYATIAAWLKDGAHD